MIDRETLIEESVRKVVSDALVARGYDGLYELLEAFPAKLEKLDRTLLAIGFNFDDGGEQAEIGSDFKHRVYTIEFYVFGVSSTQGRNFANVLKFAIENGASGEGTIPLLDVSQDPPTVIDTLVVNKVHAQRVPIVDPEPWQMFTWITVVTLDDWYYAHTT